MLKKTTEKYCKRLSHHFQENALISNMILNVTLMKSHILAFSEGTWYEAIAIVISKQFLFYLF